MPELPDVENFRRFLERTALDRTVADIAVINERVLHRTSPAALRKAVRGHRFEQTCRHGKHLFVRLDNARWLTFHFGMTGGFQTFRDLKDEPRHDRVRFDFADGNHLAFVDQRLFGDVGITKDVGEFVEEHELGPDALGLKETEFAKIVTSRSRKLKSLLMDQAQIAGIGNEYSDEILFHARLHPETRTNALKPDEISGLYRAMRYVLRTAIERGAGMEGFEKRMPADFLLSRRREGAPCPVCGTAVEAIRFGGRTAYYCPRCQPGPGH